MSQRVLVLIAALFLLAASAAKSQTLIVNNGNHYCLDTKPSTPAGIANVVQSACNSQQNQLFTPISQQDGSVLIQSQATKSCLSPAGGAIAPLTPLVTAQCSANDPTEAFSPIPQADGGYALLHRYSGLCVSNVGSMTSGAPVLLADCDLYPPVPYTMSGWSPAQPAASSMLNSMAGKASASTTTPAGKWRVISGLNIKGNYQLFGSGANGVLLTNSKISGSLLIEGVKHVYVKGNTIGSIWFPDDVPTDDVTIDGNEIVGGVNDCIQIHDGTDRPTHVVIKNNDIHDCGTGHPGSGLYHAIYVQVPDVTISANHIWNARAAVSIRTSGLIQNNVIENVTNGGAIEYFSDHDAPPGGTLNLQGNTIRTTLTNTRAQWGSRRGIVVLGNGIGSNHRPVSHIVLKSNFLEVLNRSKNSSGTYYDVYTQMDLPNAKLSNNTLLNLIPSSDYVGQHKVGSESGDKHSHTAGSSSNLSIN
jgi:hypothetical protein